MGWDPNTGFDVSTPLYIYTHTSKHSSDLCGGCLMKSHKFGSCCFLLCIWEPAQKEFGDFLSGQKNICRLHLCNADSVGNNVAVTVSSAFLVLATFTVCYWIIYDTLLYDLQLIKTYLFKALCVYFTDPKCIRWWIQTWLGPDQSCPCKPHSDTFWIHSQLLIVPTRSGYTFRNCSTFQNYTEISKM